MLEISGLILLNEKYYSDKPPTVCVHNKDRLRNLQEIILNCSKLSSAGWHKCATLLHLKATLTAASDSSNRLCLDEN